MTSVAVIGGTGRLGFGLAARWARAGHRVIIGSRQAEKAAAAAVRAATPGGAARISGAANRAAAAAGDVVVLTIPFAGHAAILGDIRDAARGKVVVDTTVPLRQHRPPALEAVAAGSAAQAAQALLPDARVVAGFHTVAEALVARVENPLEGDVLICGDDPAAKAVVADLASAIGLRAVDAGMLAEAATLERLAALIIALNQRYRRKTIGVRFTGL